MNISTILDQIESKAIALPEFQRGYVWTREQIRQLMDSVYRGHPIGALLVWAVQNRQPGVHVELLLDGQQRITTLYSVIKGMPPHYFKGNKEHFEKLRFHLRDEVFEFYQPIKMGKDQLWIDITRLFEVGVGTIFKPFMSDSDFSEDEKEVFLDRLNKLDQIKNINLHIEKVTGEDKSTDVVVEIFNKVNSGGTKLSKGDLALAKICATWPEARDELEKHLEYWSRARFNFRIELLLRCVTTVLTGKAPFGELDDVASQFEEGLKKAVKHINETLNLIGDRLGLDHNQVLGGRYALPLIAKFFEENGGKRLNPIVRDKLLYWYIHSFLWGRYSGSTETVLSQDLELLQQSNGEVQPLIDKLSQSRGTLKVSPDDFDSWGRGSRFYPLLYMLTRIYGAQDFYTGNELKRNLLGSGSRLELHHIFPKSTLYKNNFPKNEVNALANFTFLTQDTNKKISNSDPANYLATIDEDVLKSHWIPLDRSLWDIGNYRDFLTERRKLLAEATNQFLDALLSGNMPEDQQRTESVIQQNVQSVSQDSGDIDEEYGELLKVNDWIVEKGLAEGEIQFEETEPQNNKVYIFDIAWPEGLQEGLSKPIALLLNQPDETEIFASRSGYRCFVDIGKFRSFVEEEILGNA